MPLPLLGLALQIALEFRRRHPPICLYEQLRHAEVISAGHHLPTARRELIAINRIHKAPVSKQVWVESHWKSVLSCGPGLRAFVRNFRDEIREVIDVLV